MIIPALTLCLLSLLNAPEAARDDIRLVNGKVYKVTSWKIEGDFLIMETAGGTVRVLRTAVQKISVVEAERIEDNPEKGRRLSWGAMHEGPSLADPARDIAMPAAVLAAVSEGNIAAALAELELQALAFRASFDYRITKGGLLLRAGLYAEAERELESVIRERPGYDYGHFLMGQVLFLQGLWNMAIVQYRTALDQTSDQNLTAVLNNRIAFLEPLDKWRQMSSGSLRIQIETDPNDAGLADGLSERIRENLDYVIGQLKYTPPQPILVTVTRDSIYDGDAHSRDGSYDGRISIPLRIVGSQRFQETIRHELSHALIQTMTRSNCPPWLQEGLAQYVSGRRSAEFLRPIAASLQSAGGLQDVYLDGISLVEYLVDTYTTSKTLELLSSLGTGTGIDGAMIEVFNVSVAGARLARNAWVRSIFQ